MNIRNVMKYCQSARLGILFKSIIQHYNHDKYWKRRSIVVNPHIIYGISNGVTHSIIVHLEQI